MANETEYVERTDGGQEIHIYEDDRNEMRMRIDFQGVELNTWDASVAMGIQDARELHVALGKALASYDAQQEQVGHDCAQAVYTWRGEFVSCPAVFTDPAFRRGWEAARTRFERELAERNAQPVGEGMVQA